MGKQAQKITHRRLLFVFLLLPILVIFSREIEAAKSRVLQRVVTDQGVLQIVKTDGDRGETIITVTLGDKVLTEEREYFTAGFEGFFPDKASTKYIFLELDSGGSGCPLFYKIIDISELGNPRITEKFGNCSRASKVDFRNNTLRIDAPIWNGPGEESWLYRQGKLKK